ncbi:MAG: helix-turn-helix domain-containing protein [Desulfobacter sp.]
MINDQEAILDFEKILSRIKIVLGVEKDKDVAMAINMKPNAFYNRKKSGSLPLSEFVCLAIKHDVCMDWLILGIGPKYSPKIKDTNLLNRFKDPDKGFQNNERLLGIEGGSKELYEKVSDYLKATHEAVKIMQKGEERK